MTIEQNEKMRDRLTRWEGQDRDGPRAVMVHRDGNFAEEFQRILRKLARYEDAEEILDCYEEAT